MIDNSTVILPQIENIEAQNLLQNEETDESLSMRNRQALTDDEPFLIMSHSDTPEYITHMQAREALPEDHDNIFETEFGAQLEQVVQHVHNANNEIFDGQNEARLSIDDNIEGQRNEITFEDVTSSRHEDISRELPILETACPLFHAYY
ncbi:hypothetical protein OnM2_072077 [Erysiphe neolycopersici]|uniref:Uncharacterized protein n=1 Tax=Erysiphe neolycopersici TaxID=212602 RepID=A0A420HJX8_9PEZI|nr:hypothetical protein OnM2_072077 [Erysiphe neolycopersici]